MLNLACSLCCRRCRGCGGGGGGARRSDAASSSAPVDAASIAARAALLLPASELRAGALSPPAQLAIALASPHAAAFPAALACLLAPAFPHSLLGAVHAASEIEVGDAAALARRLRLRGGGEQAAPAMALATWCAEQDVAVRRGTRATLALELDDADWRSSLQLVFFGAPRGAPAAPAPAAAAAAAASASPQRLAAELSLPAALPPAWSALSHDYNPIHVSWLAAWALGFRSGRRVVAHGMSIVLLALPAVLRALAAQGPAAGGGGGGGDGDEDERLDALLRSGRAALRLSLAFVRPLFIPGAARVLVGEVERLADDGGAGAAGQRIVFAVAQEKVGITGALELRWSAAAGAGAAAAADPAAPQLLPRQRRAGGAL